MNHEILSEQMDLAGMSKEQLIGLCNTLYELLQRPAPAFTCMPYAYQGLYLYVPPTQQGQYYSNYGNVTCSSANESTQQELFGVK